MGYYSIFKYFIRRLFYFLRSITGKLFMIFILLFGVLILYMCIDKGVFAESLSDETITGNNLYFLVQQLINEGKLTSGEDFKYCIGTRNAVNYEIIITKSIGTISFNSDGSGAFSYGGCYYLKHDDVYTSAPGLIDQFDKWNNSSVGGQAFGSGFRNKVIYSNIGIGSALVVEEYVPFTAPYIVNTSSYIENWSFDYLTINSGSVGYVYYDPLLDRSTYSDLYLKYVYDGITYSMPINSGFLSEWSSDNFIVEIPRTSLLTSVNIQNGKSVDFYLEVKQENVGDNIYYLGNYTFSLTTAEQEQIQSDSDKALQGQILQQQEQINNNLSNIDNSINDSSIDDITSDTLPSDTTTDITAEGVNGIFTSIYNAFCVGNAQDIVFPIPFTDKSITLPSNYVRNALNSSGATFIITLIEAFWWYLISRFIVKDIMNKINKIKSGNIEDIETTNIRGDML